MSETIFLVETMPSSNLICNVDASLSSAAMQEEEEEMPLLGPDELQGQQCCFVVHAYSSLVSVK